MIFNTLPVPQTDSYAADKCSVRNLPSRPAYSPPGLVEPQSPLPPEDRDLSAGQVVSLGLIGHGRMAQALVESLEDDDLMNYLPGLKIVGWVGMPQGLKPPAGPASKTLKGYPDCEALFREHPRLDLACDLSDDGSGLELLRRSAPDGVSLISGGQWEYLSGRLRQGSRQARELLSFQDSHKTFLATIDQSEDEILIVDKTGLILELNQKVLNLVGGERKDYIGQNWAGLRHNLYGESARLFLKMVLEIGLPISETHCDLGPDQQVRKFQIMVYPMKNRDGCIEGLIIVRRDITAQMKLEHGLELAQNTAAVSNFSAYVAHEVRNPIMAIGGFAKRLHDQAGLDSDSREKTSIILEEVKRLTAFLDRISLSQSGSAAEGAADVNEVAREVAELMTAGEGRRKNIELSLELSAQVPGVFGSYAALKQSFINLVKNSVEAAKDGGRIVIRSRLLDGRVYLEVEDDGPGILPSFQEEVFKPFFSTKRGHSGLGLSMTRKMMGEMGGRLYLFSRPDVLTVASMALWPVPADPGGDKDTSAR